MPYDGKISTDRRYPVTLYDSNMSGVAGVASGSIFVMYAHENDTTSSGMTVGGTDWRELGGGKYTLAMGASEWWTSGLYQVTVSGITSATWKNYNFSVEVYREYPSVMQYAIYSKLPAANIASATAGVYVSGINPASLSTIVTSGNAASWNTTNANVTGILPAALSTIVTSGNAANWNSTAGVTVTGAAPSVYSAIVSSGNAANWNVLSVTVTGINPASLSSIVTSGNAAYWNDVFNSADISDIITSGNAQGWNASTATITGFSAAALSSIVTSGNAANWSGIADVSNLATASQVTNVSGTLATHITYYTPARGGYLDKLNITGNIAGSGDLATVDTNVDTLITRLTAARAGYLDKLNITGDIAGSGDLATVDTNVDTLITRLTSARAGYLDNLNIGDTVASSGQISSLNDVTATEVWSWLISGSETASGVLKKALAYVAGNVTHTGVAEAYTNVYKDALGATLYTSLVTVSGRTIS